MIMMRLAIVLSLLLALPLVAGAEGRGARTGGFAGGAVATATATRAVAGGAAQADGPARVRGAPGAGATGRKVGTSRAGTAVRLAIINTASLHVRQGLVLAGGDFGKDVLNTFSAILVQHGNDLLLFDSGLGTTIAAQYRADMPYWQRPFFRYEEPVRPAVVQLAGRGLPPVSRIILSHSHWDHASALGDFPLAEVWAAPEELGLVAHPHGGVGGAWASQLGSASIKWRALRFSGVPYAGFARSLDLYGDGSLVLVPLFGHTAGSVGLLATTASGRRYFFVGDAVWSVDALRNGAAKFWPARLLVDQDADATQAAIAQIRRVQRQHPDIVVVPAHDGRVQGALGFFPRWLP